VDLVKRKRCVEMETGRPELFGSIQFGLVRYNQYFLVIMEFDILLKVPRGKSGLTPSVNLKVYLLVLGK